MNTKYKIIGLIGASSILVGGGVGTYMLLKKDKIKSYQWENLPKGPYYIKDDGNFTTNVRESKDFKMEQVPSPIAIQIPTTLNEKLIIDDKTYDAEKSKEKKWPMQSKWKVDQEDIYFSSDDKAIEYTKNTLKENVDEKLDTNTSKNVILKDGDKIFVDDKETLTDKYKKNHKLNLNKIANVSSTKGEYNKYYKFGDNYYNNLNELIKEKVKFNGKKIKEYKFNAGKFRTGPDLKERYSGTFSYTTRTYDLNTNDLIEINPANHFLYKYEYKPTIIDETGKTAAQIEKLKKEERERANKAQELDDKKRIAGFSTYLSLTKMQNKVKDGYYDIFTKKGIMDKTIKDGKLLTNIIDRKIEINTTGSLTQRIIFQDNAKVGEKKLNDLVKNINDTSRPFVFIKSEYFSSKINTNFNTEWTELVSLDITKTNYVKYTGAGGIIIKTEDDKEYYFDSKDEFEEKTKINVSQTKDQIIEVKSEIQNKEKANIEVNNWKINPQSKKGSWEKKIINYNDKEKSWNPTTNKWVDNGNKIGSIEYIFSKFKYKLTVSEGGKNKNYYYTTKEEYLKSKFFKSKKKIILSKLPENPNDGAIVNLDGNPKTTFDYHLQWKNLQSDKKHYYIKEDNSKTFDKTKANGYVKETDHSTIEKNIPKSKNKDSKITINGTVYKSKIK